MFLLQKKRERNIYASTIIFFSKDFAYVYAIMYLSDFSYMMIFLCSLKSSKKFFRDKKGGWLTLK
jgi:hypothetical protein